MNESRLFDSDLFLSLKGRELVDYVEPFLAAQVTEIPAVVYDLLQSKLPELDSEHTVYALEICMQLRPSEFVGRAVAFLSHTDSSVCSTAYRLINGYPPKLVPVQLVKEIAATPKVDLFALDVRSGEPIRIGTNEVFIHDLVARFPF